MTATSTITAALFAITGADISAAAAAAIAGEVSRERSDVAHDAVCRSLRRLRELALEMPADALAAAIAATEGNVRNAVFDADDKELEDAEDDLLCAVVLPDAGVDFGEASDEEFDPFDDRRWRILADAAKRLFASVEAAAA